MKTVTVDDYQRVRLPDAKPRSKFAYEDRGDGTIVLTPLVPARPKRGGGVSEDAKTGLFFFTEGVSAEEAEAAALSANLDRE